MQAKTSENSVSGQYLLDGAIMSVALTDVGRARSQNEDAIGEEAELGLLVLADGMGGHKAGEVASGMAVALIPTYVREHWGQLKKAEPPLLPQKLLENAIDHTNDDIFNLAKQQSQYKGMGSTVVACLFYDKAAYVAHVGDSRLYRWREGHLQQITQDHSLREEAIAQGLYSREEAESRINKNILTRALGTEDIVRIDSQKFDIKIKDIILICSDGLSDLCLPQDIQQVLHAFYDNLPLAAQTLVDMANERGGRDNISVILARVEKIPLSADSFWQKIRRFF